MKEEKLLEKNVKKKKERVAPQKLPLKGLATQRNSLPDWGKVA